MSKETFHFLPVFFLNCAPSHCTPESLPLEGTWRESKKLYGFAWWSLIQNMVFPICSPCCFMFFAGKNRWELCKLPAADHPHVGRSNEVFAPCPDPWELEPHPMVGSRKQHENMSCILGIRDIVEIWWICWHIEMMLLYVVVFLHFAVYKLCLNLWHTFRFGSQNDFDVFSFKAKGSTLQAEMRWFGALQRHGRWTPNDRKIQQMLQKQVLSSRFCRVASTRFKLYTPVYHQLVGGLEHFFIFPFSWEFHHPNWLEVHHFSEGLKLNHQPDYKWQYNSH